MALAANVAVNGLATSVRESPEDGGFESVSCVALEQGGNVGVGVHGDADLEVPQHLHDDAGVDAEGGQDGGAGVP